MCSQGTAGHSVRCDRNLEPNWKDIGETSEQGERTTDCCVILVGANSDDRGRLALTLNAHGYSVQVYDNCEVLLSSSTATLRGCLLVDVSNSERVGIDLIRTLTTTNHHLSAIATASRLSTASVVAAMKAGASDCLEHPIRDHVLIGALENVALEASLFAKPAAYRSMAVRRVASLSSRQRQILRLITIGQPSKNIAADLNISQRTVENHRAAIARKMRSGSFSDVLHTALCADCHLMRAWH